MQSNRFKLLKAECGKASIGRPQDWSCPFLPPISKKRHLGISGLKEAK
jgi:hypothetical protein